MLTIVLRVLVMYFLVLFLYRIMGKRQLGEMQPFELVLTLIIADLVTIPMAEISVPIMHGIIPLFILVLTHFLLTFLSSKSTKFSSFLSGKPVIVINPDGIDYRALKNLNMSVDDVFEAIRGCGYFSIEQIQYAIMETNGKMSVLPKSQFAPITAGDMKIENEESFLPISIVNEGKLMEQNLKLLKLDKSDVEQILKENGMSGIKKVLLLTIDKNGKVYLQQIDKKYKTFLYKKRGEDK